MPFPTEGGRKPLTLEATDGTRVVCTGEHGTGKFAGSKSLDAVALTFTGCGGLGGACTSSGANAGEIVTGTLTGTLAMGEPAKPKRPSAPVLVFQSEGPLAEFVCNTSSVVLQGALLANLKGDKQYQGKPAFPLMFSEKKGKQRPAGLAGGPALPELTISVDGGPQVQAGMKGKILNESFALEVNTGV
jgi:hypothetical protein